MHESEKWKWSCSVVSNSSRPHGLQPTRLFHPWDFPGKSIGVGCHCLLQYLTWADPNYLFAFILSAPPSLNLMSSPPPSLFSIAPSSLKPILTPFFKIAFTLLPALQTPLTLVYLFCCCCTYQFLKYFLIGFLPPRLLAPRHLMMYPSDLEHCLASLMCSKKKKKAFVE